jgi:hypothetical protein
VFVLLSVPGIAFSADYQRQADGNYLDTFTGLKTYTDAAPTGKDAASAIPAAKISMRNSHCAIRAVGDFIDSEQIKITFGDTEKIDLHGYYNSTARTITANKNLGYLLNNQNLARLIYTLGLLAADQKYGISQKLGDSPNNPKHIPVILKALLGDNQACLERVRGDGALLSGGISISSQINLIDGTQSPSVTRQLTIQEVEDEYRKYPELYQPRESQQLNQPHLGLTPLKFNIDPNFDNSK